MLHKPFSKTGGIILFVVQFLKSLNEEGVLYFSLSSQKWEFDINRIQSKNISQDVVHFMEQKMKKLSTETQMGLKVAAFLGTIEGVAPCVSDGSLGCRC